MSGNKKQKNKWIFTLIILIGMAAFISAGLYNGGVAVKKTYSIEVLGKLKDMQEKGGKFELNQKDIDELSSMYFAKPKEKGNITLKGVNIEILDGELLIMAPISYKNIDLLFSSKGKLNLSSGDIVFDAESFKIGKIKIPKEFVVSQVSKLENNNIFADGNSIRINTSVVPFKIEEFKIVDNKILGTAEELDAKMSIKDTNNSDESTEEKPQKQTESKKVILNEAEKDLGAAKSQVETSKEQQLIAKILSTVNKMKADPSYDSTADKASVKDSYETLNPDSQDRVKSALISNLDLNGIEVIRQTFGM
jgi:uncharacterized protein YpmS